MDKYNVIEPSSDLAKLNKEMEDWSLLPFDFRMRSNEECIRRYGCTNIDLYNRIKAIILFRRGDKDIDNVTIRESLELNKVEQFNLDSIYDYELKLQTSKDLQQSATTIIIDPDITDIDELESKYKSFALLNDKFRLFSNNYSLQIWGFNVPNMYEIVKNRILNMNADDSIAQDNISISLESNTVISNYDKALNPVKELTEYAILNNDTYYLSKVLIENAKCLDSSNQYLNTVSRSIADSITESFNGNNFEELMPSIVPYFTPLDIREDTDISKFKNCREYNKALKESSYGNLLSIGWNPVVPINKKSLDFARDRQIEYLKQFSPKIINCTDLPCSSEYVYGVSKVTVDDKDIFGNDILKCYMFLPESKSIDAPNAKDIYRLIYSSIQEEYKHTQEAEKIKILSVNPLNVYKVYKVFEGKVEDFNEREAIGKFSTAMKISDGYVDEYFNVSITETCNDNSNFNKTLNYIADLFNPYYK